ncbi:MAG: hypothetical protein Q8J62_10720, partial [Candidatus Cloacimonadaceae bacterium]|nr:hypothetical protein [Candidatus Cloacimonadaceae bacterium]
PVGSFPQDRLPICRWFTKLVDVTGSSRLSPTGTSAFHDVAFHVIMELPTSPSVLFRRIGYRFVDGLQNWWM